MKKRKPGIIKDPKARGEWVESVFMARAGEHGLAVSKPWGDSASYDFVIGRPGRFVSVQVKSTVCRSGGGYECCIKGKKDEPYEPGSFDFLAAHVVLEDAWYILPVGKVAGRETVCLFSKSKYARYEDYLEAWHLLREASVEASEVPSEAAAEGDAKGSERCVEDSAGRESVGGDRHPTNALGRMEASMNFFKQRLERGIDPQKR
jgi:hypothetical protein